MEYEVLQTFSNAFMQFQEEHPSQFHFSLK